MAEGDIRAAINNVPNPSAVQDRLDYLNQNSEGILAGIDNYANETIRSFVFDNYSALIHTYSFAITSLLTIYVVAYGIAAYRGLIQQSVNELFNGAFRLIVIASLLFNYGEFLNLIYSALIDWPEEIIATMIQTVNGKDAAHSAVQIKNAIDIFFDQGFKLGSDVFNKGSFTSAGPWLWGALIMLATFILGAIPLGLALMSKIAVAILLGLTVIFLLFLLFNKTTGFFEGWIRALMTMVFLKILTYSVMVFSLVLLKKPFATMISNHAENAFRLSDLVAFFVISFVTWMLYKQVGSLASSLGSGFAMQSTGVYEKNVKPAAQRAMNAAAGALARQFSKQFGKK